MVVVCRLSTIGAVSVGLDTMVVTGLFAAGVDGGVQVMPFLERTVKSLSMRSPRRRGTHLTAKVLFITTGTGSGGGAVDFWSAGVMVTAATAMIIKKMNGHGLFSTSSLRFMPFL